MKINSFLLTLLSLLSLPSMAFAAGDGGFYVEPGLTYEMGDNKLTWPSPLSDSTGSTRGLGANLKLGFHASDTIFVGVDGAYSMPKFKQSVTNYEADATSTLYGVIIGGQMPVAGLRMWGGYIFGGELNPKASGGVDVKFQEAQGPKFGAGFHVGYVSLNVEYMDLKYNKTVLEQAGPVSGTFDKDLENKTFVMSVSAPLTL